MPYRQDVDGLRALAVILVVAYHFGLRPISGGYIGVDIFFVISGFLITKILEGDSSWRALALFYVRRLKRLVPAFVVAATLTSIAASVLLLPEDLEAFARSIRESFLFRANLYFSRVTTGYFAQPSTNLPWLHTWTLSVEWQFYLAYPLLVWAIRKLSFSARTTTIAVLTAVALVASVRLTGEHKDQAYFSAAARVFEFLLGGLASFAELKTVSPSLARAVSVAIVVALTSIAATFDATTALPAFSGLLVCLPVALLLATGSRGSVLNFSAAAFVGKRSYSIYLFHWPVVAFLSYARLEMTTLRIVVAMLAIFGLSDLSYRFVERATWIRRLGSRTTILAAFICPLVVASVAYRIVDDKRGFPERLGTRAEHAYANITDAEVARGHLCPGDYPTGSKRCRFGALGSRTKALLIGDSHAEHFVPFVNALAISANVEVTSMTQSLCLALDGVALPAQYVQRLACAQAIERNVRLIRTREFQFVIIGQRWQSYPRDQLSRLDAALTGIEDSGAIPVVFDPVAEDGSDPHECFFLPTKRRESPEADCGIDSSPTFEHESRQVVKSLLEAAKTRHPGMRVIDPRLVQCSASRCLSAIDDTPIYRDTNHLNSFGSMVLGRRYLEAVGNPLQR